LRASQSRIHVAGLIFAGVLLLVGIRAAADEGPGPLEKHLVLRPTKENPRNSEGAFVRLKDRRILFVYSHFSGRGDEAAADLVARISPDGGRTWGEPKQVVPREGALNVMSVSLLRLADGRIAMFYAVKNSMSDCRMSMRSSSDEAATWGRPTHCLPEEGYFVVNNDRVIQLKSGRLVVPAAQHHYAATKDAPATARGEATCFISDDSGASWRRARSTLTAPLKSRAGFQEPAVVELKDGRLLMLIRTDLGSQYRSISKDGGESWAEAEPTELASPLSPCSVKRVPKTGDLMVIWNDHRNVPRAIRNKRTPFSVALSSDEGMTWGPSKTLEADPNGHYCYTAILFLDDRVLLAYDGLNGKPLEIASFPLDWLYR
jgi:sialidase-1